MENKTVGRPLKFKSPEELQEKIDAYFKSCFDYARDMFGNRLKDKDEKNEDGSPVFVMKQVKPFTIGGLAVALGTYRDVIVDYENGKYDDPDKDPEVNRQFSNTIKEAKEIIKAYAEEQLYIGKNPAGVIFSMKNNYGWKDKKEVEHLGKLTLTDLVDEEANGDGAGEDQSSTETV